MYLNLIVTRATVYNWGKNNSQKAQEVKLECPLFKTTVLNMWK